ncbi:MAG: CheB methylesterase domain-containing protein [Planctomycetota bacterium]
MANPIQIPLVASGDARKFLADWLRAAGFCACSPGGEPHCAGAGLPSLAVLPATPAELAVLPAPLIVLYEPGADLQAAAGRDAELIELPDRDDARSLIRWSNLLNATLRRHCDALPAASFEPRRSDPVGPQPSRPFDPAIIAVGVSTGGPSALRRLLTGLSAARDLPPMLIVQHIPNRYVAELCQRLTLHSSYPVAVAEEGLVMRSGNAYVAPGHVHVRVVESGNSLSIRHDDQAPVRGHSPSAEVLFGSCVPLRRKGIALILTGMGRDGADGMLALRQAGWATVGQDEASSEIYGMPRAAFEKGGVAIQLPLSQISQWLVARCRRAAAAAT